MAADVENPHAGQGPVVLDIGGDVGALIVTTPASMVGVEVDIIPVDPDAPAGDDDVPAGGHPHAPHHDHDHDHDHGHAHAHGHAHGHDHGHDHPPGTVPHVAVVDRPNPDGTRAPTLVYGEVRTGRYRLRIRPDGPDGPTADVRGGEVTFLDWA